MTLTYEDVARMIDHSLLSPVLTRDELDDGCRQAIEMGVASVCIMPFHLRRCSEILRGSAVKSSTTIGFPHGANTTAVKLVETQRALEDGGEELDAVVNLSHVLSGEWNAVRDELALLTETTHEAGQKIKVIFENCYLQQEHKIRLCDICGELNVDWVKTSTGFGTSGATDDDLKLMRQYSPPHVQVKAAGGIRDLDTLLRFRDLGVTRCGSSRTHDILTAWKKRLST